MDVEDDDKTAGEILRSLLIAPKMGSPQMAVINDWQHIDQSEPVLWQIETNATDKEQFIGDMRIDNQNIIQPIPITYLAADDRNLTFTNAKTLIKPLSYILSRNDINETSKYCTVGEGESNIFVSEPQQIVVVENISSVPLKTSPSPSELFEVLESQKRRSETKEIEGQNLSSVKKGKKEREKKNSKEIRNGRRSKERSNGIFLKCKERENKTDFYSSVKPKVEKKENYKKKCLKKKKCKVKSKVENSLKSVKTAADKDDDDDKNIMKEDETRKKNLFELTKLEDNVDQVAKRLKMGCDCADSNCFDGLNPEKVFKHRLNIADLTKAELDMYLMGVIKASVQNLQETSRHKERIRIRSCYAYEGKKICLTAFLYLQHVTLYQMKRLRNHLKIHGVTPRTHGNRGRKPSNTFSLDTYRSATNFVQNYIEKRCTKTVPNFTTFSSNKIVNNSIEGSNLPSAIIQGNKKSGKVKIVNKTTSYHLPSECTKKTVHKEYILFCERLKPGQKVMKYSTFTSFLQEQFPNVKFQKMDKKPGLKCVRRDVKKISKDDKNEAKDNKIKTEGLVYKNIQTPSLVYIPSKTLHVVQPTYDVAPKQPPQHYNRPQKINNLTAQDPQPILDSK